MKNACKRPAPELRLSGVIDPDKEQMRISALTRRVSQSGQVIEQGKFEALRWCRLGYGETDRQPNNGRIKLITAQPITNRQPTSHSTHHKIIMTEDKPVTAPHGLSLAIGWAVAIPPWQRNQDSSKVPHHKVWEGAIAGHGFFAGRGLELLRISDSGVSLAGLPLKMMRFGFSASASTSAFACVLTTFKFKRTTCSCFICS